MLGLWNISLKLGITYKGIAGAKGIRLFLIRKNK
tara:strand:- start:815 stop:916 length:102 start_codon:yes stop_codon:yes gene_type:complete